MINVEHLSKYFGPVLAVDDVSFSIDRGEVVGFLGLNGAGKSTTMRMLTGYLPASSGYARVAGFDVMEQSLEVRRNVGYLPESIPLYGEMRVEEYIMFRARLKGVPRRDRLKRVDYCLDRCRLKEVRRRLLQTLSKGYRQRVGLADAMVADPPIMILDEPTTGLDPEQIKETLGLIEELGQKRTVLLSHHILSEVAEVCERVIIIRKGRIALSKTLAEIEAESTTLVEVQGAEADVAHALRGIEHITEVTTTPAENGWVNVTIETGERDAREAIGRTMAARGWPVRRLERRRGRLDEVFYDVHRADAPVRGSASPAIATSPAATASEAIQKSASETTSP